MALFNLKLTEKEALKYIENPLPHPDIKVLVCENGLVIYTGEMDDIPGFSEASTALRLYACCKRARSAIYGINRDELSGFKLLALGNEIQWLRTYLLYPQIQAQAIKNRNREIAQRIGWHTEPMIQMCIALKRRNKFKYTANDVFNALPDRPLIAPLYDISLDPKRDILTLMGDWIDERTPRPDVNMARASFRTWYSNNKIIKLSKN